MFRGFFLLILAVVFVFLLNKFWGEFTTDQGALANLMKVAYHKLPLR